MKKIATTAGVLAIIVAAFGFLQSCGGGGGGGGGGLPKKEAPRNIVFVTSTTQDGNLGGLAGADAVCNARAAAAGLGGSYVAWLSTSTVDAKDRLGTARGWVRPDGLPFADTVADLTAGKVFYPPRLDETGNDVGSDTVSTGTLQNGTIDAGLTCADWTNNSPVTNRGGDSGATTQIWTSFYTLSCATPNRIYCLGTDYVEPVSPPSGMGRMAFVSGAPFDPSTGMLAADTLCGNEATTASLPGTYKALLAADTITAASRFTLTGSDWVRPDGVTVVSPPASLTTVPFLAPLNLQAEGTTYVANTGVWKGAADFNTVGAGTSCTSWTSAVGNGIINRAAMSVSLGAGDTIACSNTAAGKVYCLQE